MSGSRVRIAAAAGGGGGSGPSSPTAAAAPAAAPKGGASRSNVMVMIRVRPLNKKEREKGAASCVACDDGRSIALLDPKKDFAEVALMSYDNVYWSMPAAEAEECGVTTDVDFSTQEDVYREAGRPVLDEALEGYNTCLLAYGQTGSGKTHTMLGAPRPPEQRGIIPRLCGDVFELVTELESASGGAVKYSVEVSFMEIYNERIRDLLNLPSATTSYRDRWDRGEKAKPLTVRQHPLTGAFVENLSKHAVTSRVECLGLVTRGGRERTVEETKMNAESSRSHAILQLTLTRREAVAVRRPGAPASNLRISRVNLVDLAGSERVDKSGAEGARLVEAANINKSLSTLRMVIDTLIDNSRLAASKKEGQNADRKPKLPPYRESLLTWILADCFGGNARLRLIATVGPHPSNFDESASTLRYAQRARRIVNRAQVNEDASARLIRALNEKVRRLELRLEESVNPAEVRRLEAELTMQRDARAELERVEAELCGTLQKKSAEVQRLREEREELEKGAQEVRRERSLLRQRAEQAERELAAAAQLAPGARAMSPAQRAAGWPDAAAVLCAALSGFVDGPQKPGEDEVYRDALLLQDLLLERMGAADAAAVAEVRKRGRSVAVAMQLPDSDDEAGGGGGGSFASTQFVETRRRNMSFASCLVDRNEFFPGSSPAGSPRQFTMTSSAGGMELDSSTKTTPVDGIRGGGSSSTLALDGAAGAHAPAAAEGAHVDPSAPPPQQQEEGAAGGEGEEWAGEAPVREECPECGRRFAPAVLARHAPNCKKINRRRKEFATQRALVDGSGAAVTPPPSPPRAQKGKPPEKGKPPAARPTRDWKKESESLRDAMRACREVQ